MTAGSKARDKEKWRSMKTRNTEEEMYRNRTPNLKTVKEKEPLADPKASSALLSWVHTFTPCLWMCLWSCPKLLQTDRASLSTAGKSEQHSFTSALLSLFRDFNRSWLSLATFSIMEGNKGQLKGIFNSIFCWLFLHILLCFPLPASIHSLQWKLWVSYMD